MLHSYGSLISSCSGSSLLASQGQIHKHGLACAQRHWLLHYVQVKPLTLCHWGVSLCVATHRDGYQNSEQIKTYRLHPALHQQQVRLQIQLGTIHCHSSCRNRFSILLGLVWRDVAVKARRLQMQTHPAYKLGETGNQDLNPLVI